MTKEYEEKLRREREELYAARKRYHAEMFEERDRIIALFQKRGIRLATERPFNRVVTIENTDDYGIITDTCFQIPEDIDLEKVLRWFVHSTKYYSCTVFLLGWNPTTIYSDDGIDYFMKYAPAANARYLAERGETK